MGPKASISVKLRRRWRSDWIWLKQWRVLSPRYARLYERLKAVASLGKQQRGVIELVGRSGERMGVRKSQVTLLLEGAKTLGFVKEPVPNRFELQLLPPISSLSRAKVEELKASGVPLFHGNNRWMDRAWPLYVHWCETFERFIGREWVPEDQNEVRPLKSVMRIAARPDKIKRNMRLFIRRHPVLEIPDDVPSTFSLFCDAYRMIERIAEHRGQHGPDCKICVEVLREKQQALADVPASE